MKLRWKEHEIIFVTVLTVASIIGTISNIDTMVNWIAPGFQKNGLVFNRWTNVLLPRVAIILLFYVAYLLVNLVIIPLIKKISFTDVEKLLSVKILKPVLVIVIASYALAFGANVISYYARPNFINYGEYRLLALFGYNDKPLSNAFFGFGNAIGLLMLLVLLAGIREFIIWLINRPGAKREFRVMVANNTTPLIFLWLLIPFFLDPLHRAFMDYLSWTTPVIALYIYHTFWLLPYKETHGWFERPVVFRLLVSSLLCTIISALFFSGGEKMIHFLLYWAFLLLIVAPLCWLLYQQRRDKILQLKNMETALATSNSQLQFLRSQINPHFLFNALNTLYGTAIKEKSEQTAEGIQMLGDMMRFMLEENHHDFIPMHKELEYLKNYIVLQKLRLPGSTNIEITDNIEEVRCSQQIAPMLLIPFVENAFKHGISFKEKSWIDISLECSGSFIRFEVKNSIPADAETDTEKNKAGIGLHNVSERLKLLYPGKHELEVSQKGNEFIAKLLIK